MTFLYEILFVVENKCNLLNIVEKIWYIYYIN